MGQSAPLECLLHFGDQMKQAVIDKQTNASQNKLQNLLLYLYKRTMIVTVLSCVARQARASIDTSHTHTHTHCISSGSVEFKISLGSCHRKVPHIHSSPSMVSVQRHYRCLTRRSRLPPGHPPTTPTPSCSAWRGLVASSWCCL